MPTEPEPTPEVVPPQIAATPARIVEVVLVLAVVALGIGWIGVQTALFLDSNRALWSNGPGGVWGVFTALIGPWTFRWDNSPPLELLQVAVVLALVQALGLGLVRGLQVFLPWHERWALALALGLGVSGIAFIGLTMAGMLWIWTAWPLLLAMVGLAWWWAWDRDKRPADVWWSRGKRPPTHRYPAIYRTPVRYARASFSQSDAETTERPAERLAIFLCWAAILVISGLTLWHGAFYPETYWDSLILYLGYARMTFLEHAFPFKAEAQVGIGLGANYPKLFTNYGAWASTLFAHWTDLHQRVLAPLAGLAAIVLVACALRLAFRSALVAAAGALLFRLVPHSVVYSTYASDYAMGLLLAAALAATVAYFARTRTRGALVAVFAVCAFAMHLNYLMLTLWGPAMLGVLLGLRRLPPPVIPGIEDSQPTDTQSTAAEPEDPFLDEEALEGELRTWKGPPDSPDSPSPFGLFLRPFAWGAFVLIFGVGSIWFARNYALTGNPVYAFFPQYFPQSVRMNTEVLRSAEIEWFLNGDGIGRVAEEIAQRRGAPPITPQRFERHATLRDRLVASWLFWIGFDTVRATQTAFEFGRTDDRLAETLRRVRAVFSATPPPQPADYRTLEWPHAYKMNPLAAGWLVAGLVPALWLLVLGLIRPSPRVGPELVALLGSMLLLGGGLMAYMYLLADFYLYQIVPVLVPVAIIGSACMGILWRLRPPAILAEACAIAFAALLLVSTFVPGIAMAAMNFKFIGSRFVMGQQFQQLRLDALRNPGMPPGLFMRLTYGEDPDMWDYANLHLKGERLLTHENRHLMFDPSITLVHLDDWEIQQGWDLPSPEETARFLAERNIRWYLRTPNEARHGVNDRLCMDEVVRRPDLAQEEFRAGENVLFLLLPPPPAAGS